MKLKVVIAGVFVGLAATACGTVDHAATQGAASHSAPASSASSASGAKARGSSTEASSQVATASEPEQSHPAAVPAPPAKASARPVVFDCLNRPVVEPSNYVLTCADNGSFLYYLTWSSWTAARATATGVHELNNCTPNCAEGKFQKYPAVITFWRPEPLAGHPGETYFTRITVRYTGPRPPMYMSNGQLVKNPASWTGTLGS